MGFSQKLTKYQQAPTETGSYTYTPPYVPQLYTGGVSSSTYREVTETEDRTPVPPSSTIYCYSGFRTGEHCDYQVTGIDRETRSIDASGNLVITKHIVVYTGPPGRARQPDEGDSGAPVYERIAAAAPTRHDGEAKLAGMLVSISPDPSVDFFAAHSVNTIESSLQQAFPHIKAEQGSASP